MPLDTYLEAFAKLRCGRVGDHLRPHKPVMLLAVMDLFEAGEQIADRIEYQSLLEPFARYFDVVREGDDQCTPINPYFYLRGDGFWHHQPRSGQEAVLQAMSNPPGVAGLLEIVDHVKLDDELHALLCSAQNREILRQTIIDTYFAKHREQLNALIAQARDAGIYEDYLRGRVHEKVKESDEPGVDRPARDAAFSKVVRSAYDWRCAACGLRILLEDATAIVDAAHIIPFSETHDNDPRNGIALCKNHHWAMDRNLLAPGPDLKWHVSPILNDRVADETSLLALNNETIITPRDNRYHPKAGSLEWRMLKLRSA